MDPLRVAIAKALKSRFTEISYRQNWPQSAGLRPGMYCLAFSNKFSAFTEEQAPARGRFDDPVQAR